MRLLSPRKGYPKSEVLHSISNQNFLLAPADKFKSWRVPVDGKGVVLGAVLFGVFQADLQVAALFQQGEQVQFFSTQLVLQLRLLDPHVDVATAYTLNGFKLHSWQTLHVYNPSALWCPLTSVKREENQEIPHSLMPRDTRNRQALPRWIFLANRRLFRLIHVSRTTDGKSANTGHTSRLWKLLECPSKTWFKNMFVLVLLFLEVVPNLKLWWALNVLARYFRKLIQNWTFCTACF